MRNLKIAQHRKVLVEDLAGVCYRGDELFTLQLTNGTAVIRSSVSAADYVNFDVPEISPGDCDKVISMHYNEHDNQICIVMAGGDIILVRLEPTSCQNLVEIIGTLDDEVLAAEWSPDNEVLAVATKTTLNLLTQQFDTLSKIDLEDQQIKLTANQVSVGWGRAETQFRGKKSARDPTLPDVVDSGQISEKDQDLVQLSWRGDASFVSMCTIRDHRRVIWVFSREGLMESTSEPVDYQLDFVAWKPDGSLITAVQRVPSGNHAIFFERNGLRHGDFNLRTESLVLGLEWNMDSTILAVLYSDFLDLWTCSNYHYYHKLRIPVSDPGVFHWQSEDPQRLVWQSGNALLELELLWSTATHHVQKPADFGAVAVIDGQTLNLTPLRIANVPPPMAYRQLSLPDVPMDVVISHETKLIIVLYRASIAFYSWDLSSKPITSPRLLHTVRVGSTDAAVLTQIVHSRGDETFCLSSISNILKVKYGQRYRDL